MRLKHSFSLFLIVLLLLSFLVSFPFFVMPVHASETRYFCSSRTLVNGLTAYNLLTTNTASELYSMNLLLFSFTKIGIRAFIKNSTTPYTETEMSLNSQTGTPQAQVTIPFSNTHLSNTTSVSATNTGSSTDSVVIRLYGWNGTYWNTFKQASGVNLVEFQTEQLGASQISAATWTITYYFTYNDEDGISLFYWGKSTYPSAIAGFAWSAGAVPSPTYSNVGQSKVVLLGGETADFTVNWNAASGNLGTLALNWNSSGQWGNATTYNPLSTSTYFWNVSVAVNITGNINLSWYMWANNTDGTENRTATFTFYVWKFYPTINQKTFGETQGDGNSNFFFKGAHWIVYFAYQNSSFTPWWYMQVQAYDINTSSWIGPYNVYTEPPTGSDYYWNDGHKAPSISITPSGYLVYLLGYNSPCYYKLSTNNASSETNTTKLITEWGSAYAIGGSGSDGYFAYPYPLDFSDKIFLVGRSGLNTTYTTYNMSQTVTLWCNGNDSTYPAPGGGWNVIGSQPYLDDGDSSYVWIYQNSGDDKYIGWFTFEDLGDLIGSTSGWNITLNVYTTDTLSWPPYVVLNCNGTDQTVGYVSGSVAGWTNFTVTPYFSNNKTAVNAAKIKIYEPITGANGFRNVSRICLTLQYEGWCNASTLSSQQYINVAKNGTNILMSGVSMLNSTDIYFCYSPDEGVTWKNVSGTALSIPIQWNSCFAISSPYRTEVLSACLDENNLPFMLVYYTENSVYPTAWAGGQCRTVSYSTTLGSAGSWTLGNATDEYGNNILISSGSFPTLDSWFVRPMVYTSDVHGYVNKYVRLPSNITAFHSVWNDTTSAESYVIAKPIQNALQTYSAAGRLESNVCGNATVGISQTVLNNTDAWATAFVAKATGLVTGMRIYANSTFNDYSPNQFWKGAIYSSSFSRLANTSEYVLTSGSMGLGWLLGLSFSPAVQLTSGTTYYLAFSFQYDNATAFYWNPSYVNTTFRVGGFNYATGFPSSVSPTEFYNRTITVMVTHTIYATWGLGPAYSLISYNTTTPGAVCLVSVFWQATFGLPLQTCLYSTNNTGSWAANQSVAGFGGLTSWGNFTLTLDATASAVQFQEWVNDTNNNWGTTGVQTITLRTYKDVYAGTTLGFVLGHLNSLARATSGTLASIFDIIGAKILSFNPLRSILSSFTISGIKVGSFNLYQTLASAFTMSSLNGFTKSIEESFAVAFTSLYERIYAFTKSPSLTIDHTVSGTRAWSFTQYLGSALSFVVNGLNSVIRSLGQPGSVNAVLNVGSANLWEVGKQGSANVVFAGSSGRAWTVSKLLGSALSFVVEGLNSIVRSLGKPGSVNTAFNIGSIGTWGVSKQGSTSIGIALLNGRTWSFSKLLSASLSFVVDGLFSSFKGFSWHGSISIVSSISNFNEWIFSRQGSNSLGFAVLGSKGVGLNLSPNTMLGFTVSGLKLFAKSVSDSFGTSFSLLSGRTYLFSRLGSADVGFSLHGVFAYVSFHVYQFFGDIANSFTLSDNKLWSFNRLPALTFSFTMNSLHSIARGINQLSSVSTLFNVGSSKAWVLGKYGSTGLSFNINGVFSYVAVHVYGFFGTVANGFIVASLKAVQFLRTPTLSFNFSLIDKTAWAISKLGSSLLGFTVNHASTANFLQRGTIVLGLPTHGIFSFLGMPVYLSLYGFLQTTLQVFSTGMPAMIPYGTTSTSFEYIGAAAFIMAVVALGLMFSRKREDEE